MRIVDITIDFEVAAERMEYFGYNRPDYEAAFRHWLARGDDVIIFSNHDLGSLASRPLGMAMPWPRDKETPPHGPDTEAAGLGWRYLPDVRLTVEQTMVTELFGVEITPAPAIVEQREEDS